MDYLEEAMRLGVVLNGDFDQGAYGRYDEPVFCGYVAFFQNSPFDGARHGSGRTALEAIEKLYVNVKDKQRLENMRSKFKVVSQ